MRNDKARESNANGIKPSKTPMYPNFASMNVSNTGPIIRLILNPMVKRVRSRSLVLVSHLKEAEVIIFGVINPKAKPAQNETAQTDMEFDLEKNIRETAIMKFASINSFLRNSGLRIGFKNSVETKVERFINDTIEPDRKLENVRSNRVKIGTVVRTMLFTDRYARAMNISVIA